MPEPIEKSVGSYDIIQLDKSGSMEKTEMIFEMIPCSEDDIPFDWRNSFDELYLQSIRFICLALSEEYIDSHFPDIKTHASDIEKRLDDSYCTVEQLKQDNCRIIDGFKSYGEQITLITENYDDSIKGVLY